MACLVVVPSVNKRYFTKKNEIAQDRKNKNSEDKKQHSQKFQENYFTYLKLFYTHKYWRFVELINKPAGIPPRKERYVHNLQ